MSDTKGAYWHRVLSGCLRIVVPINRCWQNCRRHFNKTTGFWDRRLMNLVTWRQRTGFRCRSCVRWLCAALSSEVRAWDWNSGPGRGAPTNCTPVLRSVFQNGSIRIHWSPIGLSDILLVPHISTPFLRDEDSAVAWWVCGIPDRRWHLCWEHQWGGEINCQRIWRI